MAREELGDEGLDAVTIIYEKAGRWQEAFHALKEQTAASDSIDNVVLTNSMMGIRDEMMIYEAERDVVRTRFYLMSAVIILLALLAIALFYITQTRRRHLKELRKAYDQALESDRMKTAFIQNISHEVRTPLNIIGGFSQVIANPDLDPDIEERREIARMTQKNARLITTLIDEMLLVSLNENSEEAKKENQVEINNLMRGVMKEAKGNLSEKTTIQYDTTLADDFTILTNEYMLRIIINAIVDNAVKYTPEGTITLKAAKPSDTELALTVEDTGWLRCHITYFIIYDTETIHDGHRMPDGPRLPGPAANRRVHHQEWQESTLHMHQACQYSDQLQRLGDPDRSRRQRHVRCSAAERP